jgi:glycosyltransferase involved in cell wall biosynthesis
MAVEQRSDSDLADAGAALPVAERPSPRVTVGVPVYNGERYLAVALDAILGQTFQDFEVLISDNASDDRSEQICREYALRDPRVRYFRNSVNVGANPNFNRLVRLAHGTYFKLANADDVSTTDILAQGVAILDAHPEVALCYGRTILIQEDGEVIGAYDDNLDLRLANGPERFRAVVNRIGLVNVLQGVIRTDVLKRTALLGDCPGDDVILVAELALHGQFWELHDRSLFRRMHPAAASALKVEAAKQEYVAPFTRRTHLYLTSRRYRGLFALVRRGPLRATEKLRLLGWLLRMAISQRQELATEGAAALRRALEWVSSRVGGR